MPTAYTVGHSNRAFDELVSVLGAHEVAAVADVRRFPASRRLPQFNADALATALPRHGLEYVPFPGLGGRRKPDPQSPNSGWQHPSFRAYADYMQTTSFLDELDRLMELAGRTPTAIMCAEAVPWRCHRRLIADALLVRGWTVLDITSRTAAKPHALTPFAIVEGTSIRYPAPATA
jgi:uncharacterized protein (DUF488 family)